MMQARAMKCFALGAERQSAVCQYNFAMMHKAGEGIDQPDIHKAIYFLRLAAQQGFVHAEYALGVMHLRGEGVHADEYETVPTGRAVLSSVGLKECWYQGVLALRSVGTKECWH